MNFDYTPQGTCSRKIYFSIDENGIVSDVRFEGGCNGNTKGLSSLCDGMKATDIIDRLSGTTCGFKRTSCPNEFAKALKKALETMEKA